MNALARAMSKIKGRGLSVSIERWLMVAGAALLTIGIPMIIVGWYGAARTPYVFEQIPYVISGGFLGLALTIVGGLFYFAYWLTRQVQETRRLSDRTDETLRRLEAVLGRLVPADGDEKPAATSNGTYVATKKGTMFHRPDCAVVAGRTDLRTVDADEPDFEPCRICDPLAVV